MITRARARRGFTLLELVIALSISAIAITAGYGAFAFLVDQRGITERATRETMRSWGTRETLTDWLAGARLDPQGALATEFKGLHGTRGNRSDDELTFLTTAPTALGDGESIVHLYIARDAAGASRGLAADLELLHGTRRKTVLLDSTVASIELSYRSSVFSAPVWTSSWVSNTVLPSGVRLTMLAAKGDSLSPLLRAPLVVALEGGR
jgi:prepilin-type N-terminal cleavage/methylation domain-containing protein